MTATITGIEFLDLYREMLDHQREHDGLMPSPFSGEPEQPSWTCMGCLREHRHIEGDPMRNLRRHYSFAVPDDGALRAIAAHSPGGVVEIGAGGGYWSMLLQQRGVDVIAYDPEPPGATDDPRWHSGRAWTAVHQGDHTKASDHPARTLLLCWPSYAEPWAAQAVEAYRGDTVIYIGEGSGGCTGDDRMHALLGESPYCSHWNEDYSEELPCPDDCAARVTPLFEEVAARAIPQWSGLHDRLTVYRRIGG